MFNFEYSDANDYVGIEQAKIIKISSTFNNNNQLEFCLGKDKRYLKFAECQLSFKLELPESYWLDNDVGTKLFENFEAIICHETITNKSGPLDYALTNYFFDKLTYNDNYVKAAMDTQGILDPVNADSDDLKTPNLAKLTREVYGIPFTKEIQHDNEVYLQPWRRYNFTVCINHGLSRTPDVLPGDIDVVLR